MQGGVVLYYRHLLMIDSGIVYFFYDNLIISTHRIKGIVNQKLCAPSEMFEIHNSSFNK